MPRSKLIGGLWQCSAPNWGYPRSAMSKGRVEAFSDGVFAVAATLLIFNVQLDKTAPGGLLAALLAAWPKYAAYVAGFLTIGVMWLNHHGLFERIFHLDRTLVFLACIPLAQFSPIAVVVVCAALAVYYTFERLPDITHQPAAR